MAPSSVASPSELVEAIHRGEVAARACLADWFGEPVARLIERVVPSRSAGPRSHSELIERSLRWLEMYLRSQPGSAFQDMSLAAFQNMGRVAIYRMLRPVASSQSGSWPRLSGRIG